MSWLGSSPSPGSAGRARERPAGGHVGEPPGNGPIPHGFLDLPKGGARIVLVPRLACCR